MERGELAIAAPPASFRKIFAGVLNATEAVAFQPGKQGFGHPVVARCVDLIKVVAPGASTEVPAYCRVENKPDGHGWHTDTGDQNHMPWCACSGSVLLNAPGSFEGGWFEFRDPAARHKHYLGLLAYSSDNWHRVTPFEGERRVLLIFLG